MTVETIKKLKRMTGWSYRRLCGQTGVARASLIRWQVRVCANELAVRRPGPGKKPGLDR